VSDHSAGAAGPALTFAVMAPEELTAGQLYAWSRLQESDPALSSPYFRPEFTLDVAAVRADVAVAIFEQQGEAVGFFPFQRGRWRIGRPVGWPLSDFQGVVAGAEVTWNVPALMRACGLAAWDFDHLITSQQAFAEHHWARHDSPYLDLSRGFDAYYEERRRAGSDRLAQALRQKRKLEREVGDVRLEFHTADDRILETLIRWKTQQYLETDALNVFRFPWTMPLLRRLLDRQGRGFSATVSALYAGDRLAAAHFGIRSGSTFHWWFPSYERAFGAYSPGVILLLEIARAAPALGVERIDLGKGREQYKTSFMSGSTGVAEGSVEYGAGARIIRRGWRRVRERVRSSPLHGPARASRRALRRLYDWLSLSRSRTSTGPERP
jgi:CelD/BcsL family acetyltransferase involved in cellulose biosynthesis